MRAVGALRRQRRVCALGPGAGASTDVGSIVFSAPLTTNLNVYAGGATGVTPTYSRATTAYVQDHEGVMRMVSSNEPRFWGARRVQNLVAGGSNSFNATWSYLNGTSRTQITGVDGEQWAKVSCDGVTSDPQVVAQQVTPVGPSSLAGRTFTFSFWVYSDASQLTGTSNDDLRAFMYDSALFSINSITQRVTTTPTLVTGTFTFPAGTTSALLMPVRVDPFDGVATPSAGRYIYIKNAMCEEVTGQSVTTPSKYIAADLDYLGNGAVLGTSYYDTVRLHTRNAWCPSNATAFGYNPNTATLTANAATDPFGGLLAARYSCGTNAVFNLAPTAYPQMVAGAPVVQSVYLKYESGVTTFQIYFGDATSTGNPGGVTNLTWTAGVLSYTSGAPATVTSVGNGWYRASCAYTPTGNFATGSFTFTFGAAFSVLMAGFQWRGGTPSFLDTYVPTTTAAVGPTDTGQTAPIPASTLLGYLAESAGTQLVATTAAIRDLTDASWTKTTMTTARTSTGVDGVASTATRCTATGANATAFQAALVSAATSRTLSMYLRRITGTGNIDITQDNGTTWTTVMTGAGTGAFVRVQLNASILNPQIGIRIVTNTDAVDVDFVQLEAISAGLTSPLATTGASRNADSLQYPRGTISNTVGSGYVEITPTASSNITGGLSGAGSVVAQGATQFYMYDLTTFLSPSGVYTVGSPNKVAAAWGGATMSIARGGSTLGSGAFDGDLGLPNPFTIGGMSANGAQNIRNARFYAQKLSDAQLAVMVA